MLALRLLPIAAILPCLAANIDDVVAAAMQKQRIPGVAVAVVKDGRLVHASGYGVANIELGVPVNAETVFKIGSVSKQFIAAGILILEQDGKLSVDDHVSKHIPDVPASWRGIRLRHLLSHSAGLARESPEFHPFRVQPDINLIRATYKVPLDHAIGSKYQYSNLGYFTAAEVIRRVSGHEWSEFLAERIFRPLSMNATRATTVEEVVRNRADSYEWTKEHYMNAAENIAVRPSGALLSTVLDLAKWDAALNTDSPLTKQSRDKMWTPVIGIGSGKAKYGLGWQLEMHGGQRAMHHGGTLGGFKSHFARLPETGYSFIVLTNLRSAEPLEILWEIADSYTPPK